MVDPSDDDSESFNYRALMILDEATTQILSRLGIRGQGLLAASLGLLDGIHFLSVNNPWTQWTLVDMIF